MSTVLTDLPAAWTCGLSIAPTVYNEPTAGAAVAPADGDGPGFAILAVGDVGDGTTVAGRVQVSADGTTWADAAGGALPAVTAGPAVVAVRFARTAKFARLAVALTGPFPEAQLAGLIGQQKKRL